MKRWGITCLAAFVYGLWIWLIPLNGFAKDRVNFSVEAVPNDYQVDSGVSYFDLRMTAKQKTNIQVRIFNHGPDDHTFLTSIRNATTNNNGLIVYDQKKPVPLAPISLTDLIQPNTKSTFIKGGESKVVSLPLEITNNLDGTLLAGVRIEKKTEKEQAEKNTIGIQNRHSYIIGLKVRSSIEELAPEITYEGVKVKSSFSRPTVFVKLANQVPTISKPMKFEAIVTQNEKVVVRKEMDVRFAPSVYMNTPIETTGILKPGMYQIDIRLEGKGKMWKWKDRFEVTKHQADRMKEQMPEREIEENSNSFVGEWSKELMIGSTLIIFLLIGYIYRLKKQQQHP
ncbi:WxL protein peptidoglycan domain-containing protein [Exiguobacterium sp. TDN 0502]|uniref:DUF916 domain-containing protein n=1 Tax=Exiguobacterium sp. TDN 0502 TaxID=3420731 RepID=UPI003D770363